TQPWFAPRKAAKTQMVVVPATNSDRLPVGRKGKMRQPIHPLQKPPERLSGCGIPELERAVVRRGNQVLPVERKCNPDKGAAPSNPANFLTVTRHLDEFLTPWIEKPADFFPCGGVCQDDALLINRSECFAVRSERDGTGTALTVKHFA